MRTSPCRIATVPNLFLALFCVKNVLSVHSFCVFEFGRLFTWSGFFWNGRKEEKRLTLQRFYFFPSLFFQARPAPADYYLVFAFPTYIQCLVWLIDGVGSSSIFEISFPMVFFFFPSPTPHHQPSHSSSLLLVFCLSLYSTVHQLTVQVIADRTA